MKKITLMMFAGLLLRFADGLCMDEFRALNGANFGGGQYDVIPSTPRQDAVRRLLHNPYNTSIGDDLADVFSGEQTDSRLCKLGDAEALNSYLNQNPMDPTLLNRVACLRCNRLDSMNVLLDRGANPNSVEIDDVMKFMDKDDANRELAIRKVILLTRRGMNPLMKKRSFISGANEGLTLILKATSPQDLFKHLYMRSGRIKDRALEGRIMDARDQYLAEHRANIDPSIIEEWETYKREHRDDPNDDIAREIALKLRLFGPDKVRWNLSFSVPA